MLFLCGHGLEFWFKFFYQFLFGFGAFREGVVDDFCHFVAGHRTVAVVFTVFVRSLPRFDGIARNGGLRDSSFFNVLSTVILVILMATLPISLSAKLRMSFDGL